MPARPGDKVFYTQPIFGSNTISEEIPISNLSGTRARRNHNVNYDRVTSSYRFCTVEKFVEVTSGVLREIPFPTKFLTYECWYLEGSGFQRLVLFADGLMMVIDTDPAHSQAFKVIARKRLFG